MLKKIVEKPKPTVCQYPWCFQFPLSVFMLILTTFVFISSAKAQEIEDLDVYAKLLGTQQWISMSIYNIAGASISELPSVLARSEFRISVDASRGGWIGVSLRDSRGNIYDLPAQVVSSRGNDFYWTVPSDFSDGAIELTVALWDDYNESSDLMEGELDRISWSYIARKSGGSAW